MAERLAQISLDFAENRDYLYRRKHQEYQADLSLIQSADLYNDKPLEEPDYNGVEDAVVSAAPSTHGNLRDQQLQLNGSSKLDAPRTGRHSLEFVQDINDAMEQRDADLTTVAYRHNFRIEEIQKDHDYQVSVAHQEHIRLAEQLRQRLIQQVNLKKTALLKDKERLDIGDTSTHHFHPAQFGPTNGASPGGQPSQRKTRHARARYDFEDLDNAGGNSKRKRKALTDAENGSPPPAGRDTEPSMSKEAYAKLEAHQNNAPLYSIERLFSERELTENLRGASYDVLETMKRRKINNDPQNNLASTVPTNIDTSDVEDDAAAEAAFGNDGATDDPFLLAAPEMGRTTTNTSYHATRSTRVLNLNIGLSAGENLGEFAGRFQAIERIGTYPMQHKDKRSGAKEDEHNRAPPLTDLEAEADQLLMRQAMVEEDEGRDANAKLLKDLVEERGDHISGGATSSVHIEPGPNVEEA
ncbi:hypothetical protein P7C71_g817, partial [Lecanoromycetidae sp. Uapishka_2]